ncbi:hypothetical protein A2769_00725 [Candidatus Daviesbacteria bacterium RIFCSPHIGHO2_01_FULL_37_27]|nr:MAG: hypothetical protein A2769_00725 [Candidatus Daviesbacteria bacterium RIFCSPHIGHO2_01_FULL_37_27]
MKTEIKRVMHFYEGPKFINLSGGVFKPWQDYELKEDYLVGGVIVSSRRIGYLNGVFAQAIVDYKRYLLDLRLPEPNGVISVKEMIDWVNNEFGGIA